jgi:hypothetical protein
MECAHFHRECGSTERRGYDRSRRNDERKRQREMRWKNGKEGERERERERGREKEREDTAPKVHAHKTRRCGASATHCAPPMNCAKRIERFAISEDICKYF